MRRAQDWAFPGHLGWAGVMAAMSTLADKQWPGSAGLTVVCVALGVLNLTAYFWAFHLRQSTAPQPQGEDWKPTPAQADALALGRFVPHGAVPKRPRPWALWLLLAALGALCLGTSLWRGRGGLPAHPSSVLALLALFTALEFAALAWSRRLRRQLASRSKDK